MNKTPTITFRATHELRAKLKKAAHRLEISQGDFICLALELAIQKALQESKA